MDKKERRKFNRELHKEGKNTHGNRAGMHKQTANNLLRLGKEKEQRRQTLSAMGKEGQKELLKMANVHIGNKLVKPTGFWNPDGKIQGSGGSHRGHQHIRNEPKILYSRIITGERK